MNAFVKEQLAKGLANKKAKEEASHKANQEQAARDVKHWHALVNVAHAVLAPLNESFGHQEWPEGFIGSDEKGWHATDKFMFTVTVEGVGEVARHYGYSESKKEWYAHPYSTQYFNNDANWGAVTYCLYRDDEEDIKRVGADCPADWKWFDNLADALVEAQVQYAKRNTLLLQAEAYNKALPERQKKRQDALLERSSNEE